MQDQKPTDQTWKKIPDFTSYSVSDVGRVWRDEPVYRFGPGEVFGCWNLKGYRQFRIRKDDGTRKQITGHELVALAFIGPKPQGHMVCHWDGNPSNNHVENLRYGTPMDNVHDAIRHGTQARGEQVASHVLTEEGVLRIKREASSKGVLRMAEDLGVSKYAVYRVLNGSTWRHVQDDTLNGISDVSVIDVIDDLALQAVWGKIEASIRNPG